MGWKDLMKNVTDKATSVAETAQAKFEEQKQLSAIKKEEQKFWNVRCQILTFHLFFIGHKCTSFTVLYNQLFGVPFLKKTNCRNTIKKSGDIIKSWKTFPIETTRG